LDTKEKEMYFSIDEANRKTKQGSFNNNMKPGYIERTGKEGPMPKGYGGAFDESFPKSGSAGDVDKGFMKHNADMNIESNAYGKSTSYKKVT